MSFTTRSGVTTCDYCAQVVGRTWRLRKDHVCARTIAAVQRARQQRIATKRKKETSA